jgi:lipopolysaccharide biosynthesis glycosyltransferase
MIELNELVKAAHFADKPWLILGKGPTFSHLSETPVAEYNTISLNHAVRETKVDLAHVIDIDVVEDLGDVLLSNCRYVLIPRHPHVSSSPCSHLSIEDWIKAIPVLRALQEKNRLVVYDLALGKEDAEHDIPVVYFSSEAALGILGKLGAKTVRSLGVDGGRAYSKSFSDIEAKSKLANGQSSFDLQFQRLDDIAAKYDIDYRPIVEPMLIFVGADDSQMLAANVLAYSIHKHASRPVRVVPMCNLNIPAPKDEKNRARTGFSFYRFAIPGLAKYRARALYLDSDMLVFQDLAELWDIKFGQQKILCTTQGVPDAWINHPGFHPGRQFSVMLLDCQRLPWKIEEIIDGLDQDRYSYAQLMFECCLVKPEEIEDRIPPAWNCLEHYEEGESKLLHYTVIPTQPWTCDANPLGYLWEAALKEALETGWISAEEIDYNLEKGYLRQSLAHFKSYATVDSATPKAKVHTGAGHSKRLQDLVNDHASVRSDFLKLDKKHRHLEASFDNMQEQLAELKTQLQVKSDLLQESISNAVRVEEEYKARVADLENSKHAIYKSTTWKLGRIITKPAQLLRPR